LGLACQRPKVTPPERDGGLGAESPEHSRHEIVGIDKDAATNLASDLSAARSDPTPERLGLAYSESASILSWRGSSSWTMSAGSWAEELKRRGGTTSLQTVSVVGVNSETRIVLVFSWQREGATELQLVVAEAVNTPSGWRVANESEIERIPVPHSSPVGYSSPTMADLSYRAKREIAILRMANAETRLLLVAHDGDKLLDVRIEKQRDPCAKQSTTEIVGPLRVYERDALVLERRSAACASSEIKTSIIGVRGLAIETLMALEHSKVDVLESGSITVEHTPSPDKPAKMIRFVPGKAEGRLVLRAEPAD